MNVKEKIELIFKHIRTAEEREEVEGAITVLRESRYHESGSFDIGEILREKVSRKIASIFQEVIASDEYRKDSATSEIFFSELEKSVRAMRPLSITLAVEPDEKTIERASSWVTREVGKDIYLVFKRDGRVLGGAELVFAGRYRDFSLAWRLETFFWARKEDVRSMIHPS